MFRLVDDVASYPEFLPWCSEAIVEREEADTQVATLELQKGGLRRRFTTFNTRSPYSAIDIALAGGPFRRLSGGWRFRDLAPHAPGEDDVRDDSEGCKVSLELEFAFDSRLVDMMFGPFFEETCNSLVDAFTRRAAEVYGAAAGRA